ncbi:MAG: hypothetical protein V3U90_01990, partial [Dehalococcoidia bacterium]
SIARKLRHSHQVSNGVIEECQSILKEEIQRFKGLVGQEVSVAAHGDRRNKKIQHLNSALLDDRPLKEYGVSFSADDPPLMEQFDARARDKLGPEKAIEKLLEAMEQECKVILFLTHPHLWCPQWHRNVKRGLRQMLFWLRHPNQLEWVGEGVFAWERHRISN